MHGRRRLTIAVNRLILAALGLRSSYTRRPDLVRLGSPYGGWWVPLWKFDGSSVCYCAGVGEDTTFDEALMLETGCRVVAMDPTPRAADHVAARVLNDRFDFLPVGLAGSDRIARFFAPRDPAHVSYSITNLQHTSEYFEAPVKRLGTIFDERKDTQIDLLKLDIEGAEHEVLADLCASELRPRVVCVEFDQPDSLRSILASIRRMWGAGYFIAKVERFNVTFALS